MTLTQMFTIKEFTGRHMLVTIVSFFAVVIAVNMTMAWFALGSWSGLVAKNGYVASLEYKDKEEDFARQQALGWKSRLRVEHGHVLFMVKDSSAKAVTGLSIIASAKRPITEKGDEVLKFTEQRPGEYIATAPTKIGQWQIWINATSPAKEQYRKEYRVLVKPSN